MTDTPFAQRLRCVMGVQNLSMREIGEACGVTPQAVHRWVREAIAELKEEGMLR